MMKIEGTRKVRNNEDAKRGVPMTAPEVRWYIDQMERRTKDIGARKVIAENAIKYGNIAEAGKDVYRQYLTMLS